MDTCDGIRYVHPRSRPGCQPRVRMDTYPLWALHATDGVKIDACGSSHDVSHYAELFNKSGRPVRIENCHNQFGPELGPNGTYGDCPMNM